MKRSAPPVSVERTVYFVGLPLEAVNVRRFFSHTPVWSAIESPIRVKGLSHEASNASGSDVTSSTADVEAIPTEIKVIHSQRETANFMPV